MISVIIPAYNEEHSIAACLTSLSRQTADEEYEVILVDNGSTDKTVQIAQEFQHVMKLTIIPESRKGRGRARRTGWSHARGRIVLSTDADATVPPDWIEKYIRLFEAHPHFVAFTGNALIQDFGPVKNVTMNILQVAVAWMVRGCAGYFILNGFNFGARRWAYLATGGFNPTLDAQEDMELGKRMQRFGKAGFSLRNCTHMSGRRFKQGLIRGSLDYPKTYIQKFWLKKDWVPLEDVR